ncbi:MAG: MmcQ/YjbR family DNA-binding protein [Pararhodobacter sp.]|nr:MmcQ/YjbR family DNA-binding protein [Pararhodobacter sp.]
MKGHFARVLAAADSLPNVTESIWYRTPALRARRKCFARMKNDTTLVLLLPMEMKEMLLAARPEVFFETDHYRGYPALLVRMAVIDDDELAHWIAQSWASVATKTDLRSRPDIGQPQPNPPLTGGFA